MGILSGIMRAAWGPSRSEIKDARTSLAATQHFASVDRHYGDARVETTQKAALDSLISKRGNRLGGVWDRILGRKEEKQPQEQPTP